MPVNRHALRALRERSGLSVSALAVLAAASQPHLSNIERGRRQASPALICRLAEALKVPVVALLAEAETIPGRGALTAQLPASPSSPPGDESTQHWSDMTHTAPYSDSSVPPPGSPPDTSGSRSHLVQVPGPPSSGSGLASRRARRVGLGVAGLMTAAATLGVGPAAQAETYYTGQCSVLSTAPGGTQLYYRSFQAAIVGSIEQGTGKYIWDHYDYKYWVDPSLSSGGSSDEVVSFSSGYDSGLRTPWASPDNHGSIGSWLHEYNWKGAKSYWGYTKVKFHAAFDVPSVPDPHCDAATGTV